MKILRIISFFIFLTPFCLAQGFNIGAKYGLKKSAGEYSQFIDGFTQTLSGSSALVEIPLGFSIMLNRTAFRSVYCGANGYTSYDISGRSRRIYSCHLNNISYFESVVSYKTEGELKSRICKIQWELR